MQPLLRALDAYQSGQYAEALLLFRRALAEPEAVAERERVLMWIACCAQATGDEQAVLDSCAELLGSPDEGVRRFARALMRRSTGGEAATAGLLAATVRLYGERFAGLLGPLSMAALQIGGAALLAGITGGLAATALPHRLSAGTLGLAQAAWWAMLALLPWFVFALVVVDRLRWMVNRQYLAVCFAQPVTTRLGEIALLAGGVVVLLGIAALIHPACALVVALWLEPWCVCLVRIAWGGKP